MTKYLNLRILLSCGTAALIVGLSCWLAGGSPRALESGVRTIKPSAVTPAPFTVHIDHDFSLTMTREDPALIDAVDTLRGSTRLPEGTFDPSGRYLPDELPILSKIRFDEFASRLSGSSLTALFTLQSRFNNTNCVEFIRFWVSTIEGRPYAPSQLALLIANEIRMLAREYPPRDEAGDQELVKYWRTLSNNRDPIFRLMAIEDVCFAISDKSIVLNLLLDRTQEVDPNILRTLISKLREIGGAERKKD